jgi:uncharacterized protein YkwD
MDEGEPTVPVAHAPAHHAPAHHAPAHHAQARLDRVERAVLRAVNRIRARRGLPRLRADRRLSAVATRHSRDLLVHGLLSHSSSDGTPFWSRIRRAADARTVGETLIEFHGSSSGGRIVRAWMHSPPHRAELLAPGYRRIGIGRVRAGGVSVVTADFASRR